MRWAPRPPRQHRQRPVLRSPTAHGLSTEAVAKTQRRGAARGRAKGVAPRSCGQRSCTRPLPPTHPPPPPPQAVSYVSRRRLDDDDFDPNAVDEEGLPLVRTARFLQYLYILQYIRSCSTRVCIRSACWHMQCVSPDFAELSSPRLTTTRAPGSPQVYNEERIASYWGTRPGELAGRCETSCMQ